MRLKLVIILFFVSLICEAHRHKEDSLSFYFTENKGQFHSNANFRAPIPGGYLFLENNKFTYHFYDVGLLNDLHGGNVNGNKEAIAMKFHAYQMEFIGASPQPLSIGAHQNDYFENFYLGNQKEKWVQKANTYQEINYNHLYPGIDMRVYAEPTTLKYDLIVRAGATAEQIKWEYIGLDNIALRFGKLYLNTSLGETIEDKPFAYQIIDGKKKKVPCRYVLDHQHISYEFPKGYDSNYDLIIDPTLVFSTYSGATSSNFGYSATYDAYGYLYSGSSTFGIGYPTTIGAYQLTWAGGTGGSLVGVPSITGTDIAITKWDTNGTQPIYSTYLGGASDELPHSLIVNENSELYVMGTTGSSNYPTTTQAYDTSFNTTASTPIVNLLSGLGAYYPSGSDICITKFDSSGSNLLASTFLGGTNNDGLNTGTIKFNYADEIRGEIELDQLGDVYVVSCTRSDDIPIGGPSFQPNKTQGIGSTDQDAVIFKLDSELENLLWSSYIGGDVDDAIYSIAIDSKNDIVVSGGSNSTNFPTQSNVVSPSHGGARDGFIARISKDGTNLIASTYYGSVNSDQSYFVELDKRDNVYIFGQTHSPKGHLIKDAIYHDSLGGQFVAKITQELDSIHWSTRFGSGDGNPDISPTAFLVDLCNSIYLSGWGSGVLNGGLSTNGLDTAGTPYQSSTDGHDFYLMVLADDASQLNYATYFGGSAQEHVDGGTSRFDKKGKIYQAVCAGCPTGGQGATSDFPTLPDPGAHSNSNGTTNSCNLAVFKMDFNLPVVVADFIAPAGGCVPYTVNFDNISLTQSNTNFHWDFGDGTTSTNFQPQHTYTTTGTYVITLVVSDTASCNLNDTLQKQITIGADSAYALPNAFACLDEGVQIGLTNNNNPDITYTWSPTTALSDTNIANPFASPTITTQYTVLVDNGFCLDTISQLVQVDTVYADILGDTFVCSNDAPFLLTVHHLQSGDQFYWSTNRDFSDTLVNPSTDSTIQVTPTDSITVFYVQVVHPNGCVAIDSLTMRVRDLAEPLDASFDYPGVGCAPYTVNFNNTSDQWAATHYNWNFDNGSSSNNQFPSTIFNQKGTYSVTLIATDSSICPQGDTFSLDIHVRADTNYQLNFNACLGQPLQIGIPPDTLPGINYTWTPTLGLDDPTVSNPYATLQNDTTFLLVVDGVCLDSITNRVQVEPIYALTDSLVTACSNQNSIQLSGNSNGTGTSFVWSYSPDQSDTLNILNDSTYQYLLTDSIQRFYFTVQSAGGCLETDSIDVVVTDLVISTSQDQYICENDTAYLEASSSYTDLPLTYNWTPIAPLLDQPDQAAIRAVIDNTTQFYISAIDDSGCIFRDSILVEKSPLTEANTSLTASPDTVIRTLTTQLQATPANGNFQYRWIEIDGLSDTTIANPIATPPHTIVYGVQVIDTENPKCKASSRILVVVKDIICGEPEIFIPNAFSPDGDGENDELKVYGENIVEMDLKIYNRWGEMVFETQNKNNGWKGSIGGEDANNAVYMYHLDVTCVNGETYFKKGNITLLR